MNPKVTDILGHAYPVMAEGEKEPMEMKTTPGVRSHVAHTDQLKPGEYALMDGTWWACVPEEFPTTHGKIGVVACLRGHEVTRHEDGTITVSPSILVRAEWAGDKFAWHGYLERGVWREV